MVPRPRKAGSKDLPENLYKKTDKRNGKTYYTYRDPVSGRFFGLGTNKALAISEAINANLNAQPVAPTLQARMQVQPKRNGGLFSVWISEYLVLFAERGLSDASVKNGKMHLKRLVAQFGHLDVREVSTFEVASYLGGLAKEGKAQMARALRSRLSDVFAEAIAAGWCEANPVDVTKAARVTIKRERLTLEMWLAIYGEAKQEWLRRAMELALLTGQRREDIAGMMFKRVEDDFLHVVQLKTGARIRLSTSIRLDCIGLDLAGVIKRCRDGVVSPYMVHHSRTISRAKAGQPIMLDTLSSAFAAARDSAASKGLIQIGDHPPTFHEQRSLAARLHKEQGRDPQRLLGHRSEKMTGIYLDSRGAEWVDVVA